MEPSSSPKKTRPTPMMISPITVSTVVWGKMSPAHARCQHQLLLLLLLHMGHSDEAGMLHQTSEHGQSCCAQASIEEAGAGSIMLKQRCKYKPAMRPPQLTIPHCAHGDQNVVHADEPPARLIS